MDRRKTKSGVRKEGAGMKLKEKDGAIAYRLKCAKTANGLSHFSMYGDVPKEKTVL